MNGEYEFTAAENETLRRTGMWASVLGGVLIVQGVIELLDFAEKPLATIVSVVISIIIGGSFLSGGGALKKAANTQGTDIAYLMEAYKQLGRAFQIRIVLVIIVVALVMLGLFFGMAGAAMM